MASVANFSIDYQQYIDADGEPVQDLPDFCQDKTLLHQFYYYMVLLRQFDKKTINLQRTGQMGTYPSILGQEALSVATGGAMAAEDVLAPYYRDIGAQFQRGILMTDILNYWGGNELGSHYRYNRHDLPIAVPIASQCLQATGIAKAFQYRRQKHAVVTTVGEGGTSKGDFYEAVNVTGAWNLPVIFVINNNQWAISVSREKQTATETIAQKGIAGGLPCFQVDGNDVIAVYDIVKKALAQAYQGNGGSVIEAVTYRLCDHTTADDASRYCSKQALDSAWQREPISRMKKFLINQGMWDAEQETTLLQRVKTEVNQAVETYLKTPKQTIASAFDYMYETLPEDLIAQKEIARHYGGEHE